MRFDRMGRRKRGKERETADEVKDSLKERDSRQDVLDDDSGLDTISRVQNWLSLDSPLKTRVFLSITALGVSSIITQLLIMREFMSVFHGNELVFGIILASWLLLDAVGAALGRWAHRIEDHMRILIASQVAVAVLPFLHLLTIRLLRNVVFQQGRMVGFIEVLGSALVLLAPYCIISGFLLTLACLILSRGERAEDIGEVYFMDNIGDILGGVLFSFLLVHILRPFHITTVIFIVNMVAAVVIARSTGRRDLGRVLAAFAVATVIAILVLDIELATTRILFSTPEAAGAVLGSPSRLAGFLQDPSRPEEGLADLVFAQESPYGKLVVTRERDQLTFWESGTPLFTTGSNVSREETVHYAMLQHPAPEQVLIISGGVAGTALEALKYGVERIDYVELDPLIIEVGKRFTRNLDDERIHVHAMDGRLYVRQTTERYDVVIIDLPDPTTTQINRFYTREFMDEVARILRPGGVVSLGVEGIANYVSAERRQLNSAVYRTLASRFDHVTAIPGGRTFFVAGDRPLRRDIPQLVEERGIPTQYVRREYIGWHLTKDRLDLIDSSLTDDVGENTDLRPVTSYYALLHWMAYFDGEQVIDPTIPVAMLIALCLMALVRTRPVPMAILTTGLAGSALAVVLVVGFQLIHGYVYSSLGLLVTAFMAGLAIGSNHINKMEGSRTRRQLIALEVAIAAIALLIVPVLTVMSRASWGWWAPLIAHVAFPLLNLIVGVLVGMEFPLAASLHFSGDVARTASALYAADLVGSCVGALIISALLIPFWGIPAVCVLVAVLNLVTGFLVWREA
jgi:spermidine synthase